MIIRLSPIDNAWHRAAGLWFVALLVINCLAWPSLDHYNINAPYLYWLALAFPLGALLLAVMGYFHEPRRVRNYVSIIGILGVLPVAFALLLPLILLLLFQQAATSHMLLLALAYLVVLAYWAFRNWKSLRSRIVKTRYFENETKEDASFIYLNRSPEIDLDAEVAEGGAIRKMSKWIVPKMIFLLPAAYLMQSFLSRQGGTPAVLLLVATLCTPLAIHVATRMCGGFYLWIYRTSLLERASGKAMLLSTS